MLCPLVKLCPHPKNPISFSFPNIVLATHFPPCLLPSILPFFISTSLAYALCPYLDPQPFFKFVQTAVSRSLLPSFRGLPFATDLIPWEGLQLRTPRLDPPPRILPDFAEKHLIKQRILPFLTPPARGPSWRHFGAWSKPNAAVPLPTPKEKEGVPGGLVSLDSRAQGHNGHGMTRGWARVDFKIPLIPNPPPQI